MTARLLTLGILAAILSTGIAEAKSRTSRDQSVDDPNRRYGDMITVKRVRDRPEVKSWFTNYFGEFTGPSADFALPLESYSPYNDYYSPMSYYQTLDLGYIINPNHKVGVSVSANKPLQEEVLDSNANTYSTKLTIYDPNIFLQANNVFTNGYSWVNTKLSVDLPMSDFAKKSGYITGFYIGPVWNFRLPNPSYYLSLNLDMYYYLFQDPQGFTRFQTGVGHTGGYRFTQNWSVDTTTVLDFSMISQGQNGYTFAPGSVDRLKLTLRFQPVVDQLQFGAFVMMPLYHRTLDRTAIGLNTNLWF